MCVWATLSACVCFRVSDICAWVLCEEVASYLVIWYLWVWISMNVYKHAYVHGLVCVWVCVLLCACMFHWVWASVYVLVCKRLGGH